MGLLIRHLVLSHVATNSKNNLLQLQPNASLRSVPKPNTIERSGAVDVLHMLTNQAAVPHSWRSHG